MEVGTSAEVIRSETTFIQSQDLQRLMGHQAVALHIPGFYDEHAARELGKELAKEALSQRGAARNWKISTSRGLESSDVSTLGAHVPYNIASSLIASSPSSIDDYFNGVQKEFHERRRLRRNCINAGNNGRWPLPHQWPLDLLRLQLDEAWPSGAGLARETANSSSPEPSSFLSCRPFGGGLPRIMHGPTRWKRGFIHVDELGPMHVNRGLFSANIYLQMPTPLKKENDPARAMSSPVRGETSELFDGRNGTSPCHVLDIWPTSIRSRWDWYRNGLVLSGLSSQDAESQAHLRRALGNRPVSIAVSPGDLVLFCVQRPHAAIGFAETDVTRVSLQCFIQHSGLHERLKIDC